MWTMHDDMAAANFNYRYYERTNPANLLSADAPHGTKMPGGGKMPHAYITGADAMKYKYYESLS